MSNNTMIRYQKIWIQQDDSKKNSLDKSLSSNEPNSQYTVIPINIESTSVDVCQQVAKKRNLSFDKNDFELVIFDSDGEKTFQRNLQEKELVWKLIEDASQHGHLGDFKFVFQKKNMEENDDASDDSDAEFFGGPHNKKSDVSNSDHHHNNNLQSNNNNNNHNNNNYQEFPHGYLEKRGKTNRSWKKRYFVLMEDKLYYYKTQNHYDNNKDPLSFIPLNNPPAIVQVIPDDSNDDTRPLKGKDWWYFDIHTPKRIYSLRNDNYKDMIKWVKLLQRQNEPNMLIEGLDDLISTSERLHAEEDEERMEKFSTLESILKDRHAQDAYFRYLQSKHMDEFISFWIDSQQYMSDYHISDPDRRLKFANQIYERYIQSNAKQELGEIRRKHREDIKKMLQINMATREMFEDIRSIVYNYLNRDVSTFFNSADFFRLIVTWNNNNDQYIDDKYLWPMNFEEDVKQSPSELPKIHIPSNIIPLSQQAHSPVLNIKSSSPTANSSLSSNNSNILKDTHSQPSVSKSWGGILSSLSSNNTNIIMNNNAKSIQPKRRKGDASVFADAPGLTKSNK